ncbi:MAG: response regulator [Nitrospirae bacterium]|nr:response regulator [Nitrospirota bacterium]
MICDKVLLIDDEQDFTATLAERLKLRGYDVNVACSSEEALASIKEGIPNVIFMDLQIPGLSSTDLLLALQKATPNSRIIILTGNADEAIKKKALEQGAYDFILKPFKIKEIISKIVDACEGRHPTQTE